MAFQKTQNLILTVLSLLPLFSQAQAVKIDTIPFTTKSTLLAFKGKINGIETDFALDTGAFMGVITTSKANITKIKITGNTKVTDSNDAKNKMQEATIESLHIGSFEQKNVKSVVYDMPILACNDFYLLGGNAINTLNWKIDFEKNVLYVSKTPFEHSSEMLEMPITYKNNRHFTNFIINNTKFKDCLVDFGYTGFFEVSNKNPIFKKMMQENQDRVIAGSKIAMSLSTMKINNYYAFSFDNLVIDHKKFNDLKIEIRENTSDKIGLKFFSQLSSMLIMNNTESKYYIKTSDKPVSLKITADAECMLKNGKLIVACKNVNTESSAKELEKDEEIKSINGMKSGDFKGECDFILWKIETSKNDEFVIEKLNGQKVTIKKQVLKS
jgi:hypothetical protein